jgi:hypothetical protein
MNETETVKILQEAGYNIIHIPHVLIGSRIYTLDEVISNIHFDMAMFEHNIK